MFHRLVSGTNISRVEFVRPRANAGRMRLADGLGLVPSRPGVWTYHSRSRTILSLVMCSTWQHVFVATCVLEEKW